MLITLPAPILAFLLIITTTFYSKWNQFFSVIKVKKNAILLFITGCLVAINWLTWIYAVATERLLDSSFGYYIYPLLSVFFGIVFLKEKYNRNKIISVVLVFVSTAYLIIYYKNQFLLDDKFFHYLYFENQLDLKFLFH